MAETGTIQGKKTETSILVGTRQEPIQGKKSAISAAIEGIRDTVPLGSDKDTGIVVGTPIVRKR